MTSLTPFNKTTMSQQFTAHANCKVSAPGLLSVDFMVQGPVDSIRWPPPSENSQRKNDLWQNTCLELFFSGGAKNEDPYTEINCSPSGDWNAYHFQNYRQGMTEAPEISVALIEKNISKNHAHFAMEIKSAEVLKIDFVGLTLVIEFTQGEKSYWALRHSAPKADFHDKNGWFPSAQCIDP